MKKYFALLIAIIIFLMAGCRGNQIIGNSSSNDTTAAVLYERSNLPQDDKYWYEVNNDDHVIYAVNKNDNSKKVLYKVENENYLINADDISEHKIYFLILETKSAKDEQIFAPFKICSMNKDGTDFSVILTRSSLPISEDEVVRELKVHDDILLIKTNSRTLIQYNLESKETKTVADDVTMFGIHNQKLYYISNWSLYETDMELKGKKTLLPATTDWDKSKQKNLVGMVTFVGNEIFYCQRVPYGIYQYNNGENKLISETSIDDEATVFLNEGKLYFIKSDIAKLMQYDPKTGQLSTVLTVKDFGSTPKIINGYFYYYNSKGEVRRVKVK